MITLILFAVALFSGNFLLAVGILILEHLVTDSKNRQIREAEKWARRSIDNM